MPKTKNIKKILVLGSGPIKIGQACEFDYSGTQACKVLRKEGYEVVLVNNNPATIMTDPSDILSRRTYIEPLTTEFVEKIIQKERPDALLPTVGGQTALNLALSLARDKILDTYNITCIGASPEAIYQTEDRFRFSQLLDELGLDRPRSKRVYTLEEAKDFLNCIGLPCLIRSSFSLGGSGAHHIDSPQAFENTIKKALTLLSFKALEHEGGLLIEESLYGWKEIELELMVDALGTQVVVCGIENIDPMGIHTGDSVTVAPIQTLTDREYQVLRNASFRLLKKIGITTGGCNIQFAIHPKTRRHVVIEMNPRVSRSSALASKATGFPIAKIAAQLAIGYHLHELINDITETTPSCYEPSLDYCVVKIPRFSFDKFINSQTTLGPEMKSIGEVMAIGRTFLESFHKALRSLEKNLWGFTPPRERRKITSEHLWKKSCIKAIKNPTGERYLWIVEALRQGISPQDISSLTSIDPWFIDQFQRVVEKEKEMISFSSDPHQAIPHETLFMWKTLGFSDKGISYWTKRNEDHIRLQRKKYQITPQYYFIDTSAGEFYGKTPYFYSTFEKPPTSVHPIPIHPTDTETQTTLRSIEATKKSPPKILILGSGPNRIGQGIEFDYSSVQALIALKKLSYQALFINSNPETVSTDYDIAHRLYFEPLYREDVVHLIEHENPDSVVIAFGGQTALNLAPCIENSTMLGITQKDIEKTENRDDFRKLCHSLDILQPPSTIARSKEEALLCAQTIGYPILLRPSHVLGGGGMEILIDEKKLYHWLKRDIHVSPENPLLIDKFIPYSTEIDVDAISDGEDIFICGLLEEIQEAGVHSGDSTSVYPPITVTQKKQDDIIAITKKLLQALKIRGVFNLQFAVKDDDIYLLELNARASRSLPFISKARGVSFANIAMQCMLGKKISDIHELETLSQSKSIHPPLFYVKESVFPFNKFDNVDIIFGPEMRSTGEVMGIGSSFGEAFYKALLGADLILPMKGKVFLSVKDSDKPRLLPLAQKLFDMGFSICATRGTEKYLRPHLNSIEPINKVSEGSPHIVDKIDKGQIQMIINTTSLGVHEIGAQYELRRTAFMRRLPYFSTLTMLDAALHAIKVVQEKNLQIYCLQDR